MLVAAIPALRGAWCEVVLSVITDCKAWMESLWMRNKERGWMQVNE
jgi:hypothetical protein